MLHLMIENVGVCPVEGFTLFGATTKRDHDNPLIIGTFGSGNKHSTCLLLRAGINPVVYCGSHRLSFFTKPRTIKGVAGEKVNKQVCVRNGGTKADGSTTSAEEELSVVLDYGTSDWTDISMALREYVSNALDACFEVGMTVAEAVKSIKIDVVPENKVRAKTGGGHTRVFVPLTPEVQRFFDNLGRTFLHFSEPDLVSDAILPKANRNRQVDVGQARKVAVIYRRGVFVREWDSSSTPSLFDYNLNNLKLNESRTASDWEVKFACGQALSGAKSEQVATVFKTLAGEPFWEHNFDSYSLGTDYESPAQKVERAEVWTSAFRAVYGDNAVLMGDQHAELTEMVQRKGYKAVATKADAWIKAGLQRGIKSDVNVLTEDDKAGRTYSEATAAVRDTLEWVWDVCLALNCTEGKPKPTPRCFYEAMKGESQTWGLQKGNEVLIHTDFAQAITDKLRWVMAEEVGHYITGATDMSRDFQTFFIRGWAKLALSLTATVPFGE